jgi:acetoin utilization deacetylase AcuC-like enzyme
MQFPWLPRHRARNVETIVTIIPVPPKTPRDEYRKILSSALDQLKKFNPTGRCFRRVRRYARDPLAQETLEAEDFYWLGKTIAGLGVPFFSLLEGGYSDDLPDLIFAYLKGLTGK